MEHWQAWSLCKGHAWFSIQDFHITWATMNVTFWHGQGPAFLRRLRREEKQRCFQLVEQPLGVLQEEPPAQWRFPLGVVGVKQLTQQERRQLLPWGQLQLAHVLRQVRQSVAHQQQRLAGRHAGL
jgi:hypothetical protein